MKKRSNTDKSGNLNIRLKLLMFAAFALYSIQSRPQGLGGFATNAGINFGTAVYKLQYNDPQSPLKETLVKEYNMFFPDNQLKFKNVQPNQGDFRFAYPDSLIDFALANGKTTRGHCLIWHSYSQNPTWLTAKWYGTSKWTRAQLLAIMKTHIMTVVGHYKGRIKEWDVVNEGVSTGDGHPNGLRRSPWQQLIGDDYIDSAFVWAHQADPDAYLYFNEFGAEGAISTEYAKRDTVYNLVKRLLARGIPIHGVGFQGHFGNYINAGAIGANVKKLGELGLRVSITELDMMNTTNLPNNWKSLMTECLKYPNFTSFVTWGVDDGHSWMGRDCGCLVYDSLFNQKPLIYKALSDAMKAADPTISAKRKVFAALPPASPTLVVPPVANLDISILPDSKNRQIIIDNTDAACTTDSLWTMTTYSPGYYGTNYMHDGNERLNVDRWVKWTPTIRALAKYRIFMRWISGANRPDRAPVQIRHANGDTTIYLNQTINGGRWLCLGTFTLKPGSLNFVKLIASNPGYTTADAVMFEEQSASTGLEQSIMKSGVIVFPQPFSQSTTVKLQNGETIRAITVFDASGQMVESKTNIDADRFVLGENLVPGFYLLVIKSENGLYNARMIKTER